MIFILNAEMVNDSKPGAKMFEEALKITQLSPEEVCHVGDHPENDVEGSCETRHESNLAELAGCRLARGKAI